MNTQTNITPNGQDKQLVNGVDTTQAKPLTDIEVLMARMAMLEQANAALKSKLATANKPAKLSVKTSAKGAVSVYGMGRFPVTLYRTQWERLFEIIPQIKQHIADNAGELASKETDAE